MYKKSDFARGALVIVANDDSLRDDYGYYNRLIDYLAECLHSELTLEEWERRSEEEKAKLNAEVAKDLKEANQ